MTAVQEGPSLVLISAAEQSNRRFRWTKIARRVRPRLPAAVALAVVGVLGINFGRYPGYAADEGTYYSQAWSVFTNNELAHYTYWYDHPPFGWIQLGALMWPFQVIFDPDPAQGEPVMWSARAAMLVVAVITAALLYKLGRNVGLGQWAASAAVVLWAVSPLTVMFSRQVFLDNFSLLWILVALVLATSKPRLHWHIAAGVATAFALLSKETALLAVPAVLYAVWAYSWKKTRAFSMVGAVMTLGFIGAIWLLYAAIKSELFPGENHVSLWDAVYWQLSERNVGRNSGNLLDPSSHAYNTGMGWLSEDVHLITIGFPLSMALLLKRRTRALALVPLVYGLLLLRGGYVPAMHVIMSLPFLALAVVICVVAAWRAAARLHRPVVMVAARSVVAVLVMAGLMLVAQPWSSAVAQAMTQDRTQQYREAMTWVGQNVSRDTIILVDDHAWNDLVAMGWSGDRWDGPIWHFKLDLDPEAQRHLNAGWRDVDYVLLDTSFVETIGIEGAWTQAPQLMSAITHSTIIESWGPLELRLVDDTQVPLSEACLAWKCPELGKTDVPGRG